MWAKQIERKLHMLLQRVEGVLGKGWEQHVEGKALKQVSGVREDIDKSILVNLHFVDAFLSKLNPQVIFENWVSELVSVPTFDVRNIILNIVSKTSNEEEDGVERELSVAFSHQIVTLFKEVHHEQNKCFL
jgi:dynein heavy chain 1